MIHLYSNGTFGALGKALDHQEKNLAIDRTVYHVIPNLGSRAWLVVLEGNDRFRLEYRTKEAAVEAATELAREQEPSQVRVHSDQGKVDYQTSYGRDPQRPAELS
jgi:hypothetical protein